MAISFVFFIAIRTKVFMRIKYGYWGVKENYSDTLSPKYLGLTNCVFNYNPISAITNLSIKKKKLFKIVDLLGRETTPKNNALLFYIYNDGTVEKKIILE